MIQIAIFAGGGFAVGFLAGRKSCAVSPPDRSIGLTVAVGALAAFGGYSLIRKVV